jgi:integrase
MVRYSRDDALTEREFVLLLESTNKLKEQKQLETKFILMAAGRLGLRGGEIAHIDESWVNESEKTISVSQQHNCTGGANAGEVCGYCRNRIRDYLETHNVTFEEAMTNVEDEFDGISHNEKVEIAEQRVSENLEIEDVVDEWWQPKTGAAVRSIPYDFDVRLQLTVERFFDKYDSFAKSKATLNRRVDTVTEKSPIKKSVYPHSLRATAATTHASRNVSPYALMSVMGWRDMDTARTYISASDESAAIELRSKHQ